MSLDIGKHFDDLLMGAYHDLEPIFVNSSQAIYLYFESDFLACNQKFADMLGYNNARELMSGQWPFLRTFVTNDSQEILSQTYQKTINELSGNMIEVVWKKKDGKNVKCEVIIVPVLYKEHVMAMHFITPV